MPWPCRTERPGRRKGSAKAWHPTPSLCSGISSPFLLQRKPVHRRLHSGRVAELDAADFGLAFEDAVAEFAVEDDDAARIHAVHVPERQAFLRDLEVFAGKLHDGLFVL